MRAGTGEGEVARESVAHEELQRGGPADPAEHPVPKKQGGGGLLGFAGGRYEATIETRYEAAMETRSSRERPACVSSKG